MVGFSPPAGHGGVGGIPRQLDLNLFGLFEGLPVDAHIDPVPPVAFQGVGQIRSGTLLQGHQHGSTEVVGFVLQRLPGPTLQTGGQGGSGPAPVQVGQIDGPVPSGRSLPRGPRGLHPNTQAEPRQRRRFQKLPAIGPPTPGTSLVIDGFLLLAFSATSRIEITLPEWARQDKGAARSRSGGGTNAALRLRASGDPPAGRRGGS